MIEEVSLFVTMHNLRQWVMWTPSLMVMVAVGGYFVIPFLLLLLFSSIGRIAVQLRIHMIENVDISIIELMWYLFEALFMGIVSFVTLGVALTVCGLVIFILYRVVMSCFNYIYSFVKRL